MDLATREQIHYGLWIIWAPSSSRLLEALMDLRKKNNMEVYLKKKKK